MQKNKKKKFTEVYATVSEKWFIDEKNGFEVAVLVALDSLFGVCDLRNFKKINIKENDFRAKWYYKSIRQYKKSLYGESKQEVKSFIKEMHSDYLATDFSVKESASR